MPRNEETEACAFEIGIEKSRIRRPSLPLFPAVSSRAHPCSRASARWSRIIPMLSSLRNQRRLVPSVRCGWVFVVLSSALNAEAASGDSIPAAPEDSEIRAAVKDLRDAGIRRDVQALERLYAPDYFHTNPDGSTMGREQVLASYRRKPAMIINSVEADEWRSILRDTFAVASERNTLHGKTADGRSFLSRYRITYLLERRD